MLDKLFDLEKRLVRVEQLLAPLFKHQAEEAKAQHAQAVADAKAQKEKEVEAAQQHAEQARITAQNAPQPSQGQPPSGPDKGDWSWPTA